jgi:hypothetical protein
MSPKSTIVVGGALLIATALVLAFRSRPSRPESADGVRPETTIAEAASRSPVSERAAIDPVSEPEPRVSTTRRAKLIEHFGDRALELAKVIEAETAEGYLDEPLDGFPTVEEDVQDFKVLDGILTMYNSEEEWKRIHLERQSQRFLLTAPDYQANKKLNPSGVKLDEQQLLLVARHDEPLATQVSEWIRDHQFPVLQAAKQRAMDRGKLSAIPIAAGQHLHPPPPHPNAVQYYGWGTHTGSYSYSLKIYQGDDADLDAAERELQRLVKLRYERVALFIEQIKH